MKVWKAIKDSVGFAGALIGMLWWLGVTPEMVGEKVYAVSYAVLPFVMLASGIIIGWNAKKWSVSKAAVELEARPTQEQMDRALAEKDARIAELESAVELDKSESEFLTMSFAAEWECVRASNGEWIWSEGDDPLVKAEHRKEASELGFIRIEPCGTQRHRTVPTEKLLELLSQRPDALRKVYEGIARDLNLNPEASWKDIELTEFGAVVPPSSNG